MWLAHRAMEGSKKFGKEPALGGQMKHILVIDDYPRDLNFLAAEIFAEEGWKSLRVGVSDGAQ